MTPHKIMMSSAHASPSVMSSASVASSSGQSPSPADTRDAVLHLGCVSVSCVCVFLWILCVCINRSILHKTQLFYASRTIHFRQLVEFVATIDVIFSMVFIIYYFASLVPDLLPSNSNVSPTSKEMCYELNKGIGEWFFNVLFTAGLVAILRQCMLGMLHQKQEKSSQSQSKNLRTLTSQLFTVSTWRNSWALALLVLLLAGPWVATSAVLERIPEVGPSKKLCIYNKPVWTILLPITICVTVVSVLLVSGWSAYVAGKIKQMTSFCCGGNNKDYVPSNQNSFHSYNKINCREHSSQNGHYPAKTEEFPIISQLLLLFIVLLGVIMFVVLILYGNFYSDTSQILRAQLAITTTSLFQLIVFYSGRDSPSSTRGLSVSSGDVITL